MTAASGPISSRLLTLVLALVMAAFPAAVSASRQKDCCAKPRDAAGCCGESKHGGSRDSSSNDDQRCPQRGMICLSICCRAIDVSRVALRPVGDQMLILPATSFPESMHTPILCDAIFHPPRA